MHKVFAQVLQSLFLFFGHASPLLDESQDLSIFIETFFILFCCYRRGHLYFFVVVLGLRSGCSSPSGRCFGSRSPARMSQPLLQPVLVSISCAYSSPPILTSGCGRWSCSRSPAVLSRSLPFFSSSLQRGVDVHPSGRLCSR